MFPLTGTNGNNLFPFFYGDPISFQKHKVYFQATLELHTYAFLWCMIFFLFKFLFNGDLFCGDFWSFLCSDFSPFGMPHISIAAWRIWISASIVSLRLSLSLSLSLRVCVCVCVWTYRKGLSQRILQSSQNFWWKQIGLSVPQITPIPVF